MKKVLSLLVLAFVSLTMFAQVTTTPAFIEKGYTGAVTLTFNPQEGDKGMVGATECYLYSCVEVDNSGKWEYQLVAWPSKSDKTKMTKSGDNWVLEIPNLYTFYNVPTSKTITRLLVLFTNGVNNGKSGRGPNGADIIIDLIAPDASLKAQINRPVGSQLLMQSGVVEIECSASKEATLSLSIDGTVVKTETGTSLTYSETFSKSSSKVVFTATVGSETASDELTISVLTASTEKARPQNVDVGIYYDDNDATHAWLSVYAASKTQAAKAVYVVGDFNDWTPSAESQCFKDGNYFWYELKDIEPQKEYAFQYMVVRADGVVKYISDLYSTKVLHQDDKWEPKSVDPTLMDYPEQGNGYVSVLQTAKPQFSWSDATLNFQKPDKNNLVIYEMWIYDYTPEHTLKAAMSRLDYLQNLGVNAIELMPVCEFSGNMSWGYNPNHYFAPDKAYGSETDYKQFIDECHKRGMAVILDMVFNHTNGDNPAAKLYPYGADLSQNPYFNVNAPDGESFGEDWNHGFTETRKMFARSLKFWQDEYKVDGFRMDVSHGFCGANCNDLYDNIMYYFNNGVKAGDQNAYFIMEHWYYGSGNASRGNLINQGMLVWTNINNAYMQAAMGWLEDSQNNSNLSEANQKGYVSYAESHDEERCMYKAQQYGDGMVKQPNKYVPRVPLIVAFSALLNGPQMLWQFEELGYDYSINSRKGTTAINESYRTDSKENPTSLGWYQNATRMSAYQKAAQIIQLRTKLAPQVFLGNPTGQLLSHGQKVRYISWGSGADRIYVVGNFSGTQTQSYTLPSGTWYDYLNQTQQTSTALQLAPGEVRIFTGKQYPLPTIPATYAFGTGVENLSLTTETDILPPYDVYVYSTTGQLLNIYNKVEQLPVQELPSGVYVLKMVKDNMTKSLKVVR